MKSQPNAVAQLILARLLIRKLKPGVSKKEIDKLVSDSYPDLIEELEVNRKLLNRSIFDER